MKWSTSRWFNVTFSSPSWRSLNLSKRVTNHYPKKGTNSQNCQGTILKGGPLRICSWEARRPRQARQFLHSDKSVFLFHSIFLFPTNMYFLWHVFLCWTFQIKTTKQKKTCHICCCIENLVWSASDIAIAITIVVSAPAARLCRLRIFTATWSETWDFNGSVGENRENYSCRWWFFTNPFEKYYCSQIGLIIFPGIGWKYKILETATYRKDLNSPIQISHLPHTIDNATRH